MSDELPQGWASVTIGDVADGMKNGIYKPAESYADDGIACLRMYNIEAGRIIWRDVKRMRLTPREVQEYELLPGDLLVNRVNSRELVGKSAVIPDGLAPCVFESKNIRLRLCRDTVLPEFLNYSLLLRGSQHFTHNAQQVVGMASVNQPQVAAFEFPLAPLPEQRRIVAKLEKLLGKVDSCKERLATIPVLLKRFRQAVLAAACSGRLTEDWREDAPPAGIPQFELPNPDEMINVEEILDAPAPWRWIPLQAVCDPDRSICYGVIKLGAETAKGIPCLRTSDVKPLAIDTTGVKRIAVTVSDEYRRTVLRGGELLVNVRGTLGGVAVVPPAMRGWNVSREVAVVPVQGVLPRFMAFWIASVPCQNWLTGVAKGVAYTGINIADLKLLPVAIPSLAEQQEIVRRVDVLFSVADQIQARFERARQQVEKLTPSILARAFRGELVPQDPDDEPAEALLERIGQQETRSHAKATRV